MELLWELCKHLKESLDILLPCDPEITLLGIYPRKMETYLHTKTDIQMFIETSSIMAPN